MALSQSPRKVVPLAMEDEHVPRPKPRSAGSNVTRRVFYCGVVVEGTEGGRQLSQGALLAMTRLNCLRDVRKWSSLVPDI